MKHAQWSDGRRRTPKQVELVRVKQAELVRATEECAKPEEDGEKARLEAENEVMRRELEAIARNRLRLAA
jgi:hypothetical protein